MENELGWSPELCGRIHLRAMKKATKVLVYHSGGESMVLGIASVTKEFYQDPPRKTKHDFSRTES